MRKRKHPKPLPARPVQPPNAAASFRSWLISGWTLGSALIGLLIAAILNGPAILQSARSLPDEFDKTRSQWLAWRHADSEWSGYWNSFPEGLLDIADMKLSDVDLEVTIWAKEGHIDGTIATRAICRQFPFWAYILLRGTVSGDTADVIAYDFIEGEQVDFARLTLRRDENVLTVVPNSGRVDWFPKEARIGRHPRAPDAEITSDMEYCSEERKAFFELLRRHPAE